jgi:hypothetical protein
MLQTTAWDITAGKSMKFAGTALVPKVTFVVQHADVMLRFTDEFKKALKAS